MAEGAEHLMSQVGQSAESMKAEGREPVYHDSIFPFFPWWGNILVLFVIYCLLVILLKLTVYTGDPDHFMKIIYIILFASGLVYLIVGMIYLSIESPFEKERGKILRKQTALQIWPGGHGMFARLLFYDDGLEIRCGFHRWFIPYESMEEVGKCYFPIRGTKIKTHLPKVHHRVCISAPLYQKEVLQTIEGFRRKRMKQLESTIAPE